MRWPIFSLALAIAVPVSGIKGLFAEEVCWGAVGLGLLLAITDGVLKLRSLLRANRDGISARPGLQLSLDRELQRLGQEVLAFVYSRDVRSPEWESSESTLRHPVRASRAWRAVREYEEDTMIIYRRRFALEVKSLIGEIIGTHIGQNEARALGSPRTVLQVEETASRLIEIGRMAGARRRIRAVQ
jgi:hypothetical protein